MRFFRCLICLFVLFAARVSFAQEDCSMVLVADGVDYSIFKGGAVDSDMIPLDPDAQNEPAPD